MATALATVWIARTHVRGVQNREEGEERFQHWESTKVRISLFTKYSYTRNKANYNQMKNKWDAKVQCNVDSLFILQGMSRC